MPADVSYEAWCAQMRRAILDWPDPMCGMEPDPAWTSKRGFLVSYRLPGDLATRFAGISQRVAAAVPAITYDVDTVHVTATTAPEPDVQPPLFGPADVGLPGQMSFGLSDCVARATTRWIRESDGLPELTSTRLAANRSTVVVVSEPSEALYRLGSLITSYIGSHPDQRKWRVKDPWGSHVTVARVMSRVMPGSLGLETLGAIMEEESAGMPITGSIGWVDVSLMTCVDGVFGLKRLSSHPLAAETIS